MAITLPEIRENLEAILENTDKEDFIYDFLRAFDIPKSIINRLKQGTANKAQGRTYKLGEEDVLLTNKVWFRAVKKVPEDVHDKIREVARDKVVVKNKPMFIIMTDFNQLVVRDTKFDDVLDVPFEDLAVEYAFFRPLAGFDKTRMSDVENPADIKASEKMAKIYEQIRKINHREDEEFRHDLNVFLCRLLFCFFAEDTDIFPKKACFTGAIKDHTQKDGSDLKDFIGTVFHALSTKDRKSMPKEMTDFPYVNGGLFEHEHEIPVFDRKSRDMIIGCGTLDWAKISPDIFGSMMQSVTDPEKRGHLGMHYTSPENIMKVINPLFLEDLYEEFYRSKNDEGRLHDLNDRIAEIKIFDPACGSGNFVILAYKELRILEIKIQRALEDLRIEKEKRSKSRKAGGSGNLWVISKIKLSQFYGIEIDHFAHEVAMLSLWLIEHQMNLVFDDEFGVSTPSLPLKESGNIVCGNACRLDWEKVCPNIGEIYILGNPPYLGSKMQESSHKEDMQFANINDGDSKFLDYIACWFSIGSQYIKHGDAKLGFVSTNSIVQGEQVPGLWRGILRDEICIEFAYQSFKWNNIAKGGANVICVIIGLGRQSGKKKKLFIDSSSVELVESINPYLMKGETIYVDRRTSPIANVPSMLMGNMPRDGGNFILDLEEKERLLKEFPESSRFIKKYVGSQELIRGLDRWCLWIKEEDLAEAESIPPILERIEKVEHFRSTSKAKSTRDASDIAYRFVQIQHEPEQCIAIPKVSSERRRYLPIGLFDENTVISDLAFAVYSPPTYVFSILSSRIHLLWATVVGGRLKTDYRYSNAISYNNYPLPELTDDHKNALTGTAMGIISVRESYSELSLSDLYDPDRMPKELLNAHLDNDSVVEEIYRKEPFLDDQERLECLFDLYQKVT